MGAGRGTAVLAVALVVLLGSGCRAGSSGGGGSTGAGTRTTVALSSVRVDRYPTTTALRAGATEAGDGPIGRVITAFTDCTSGPECSVVLERVDGSQVTVPTDVGDTPLSLSPDGTWLVYLRSDATVLRNLVTGAVQELEPYRSPLAWSPNGRRLMFGGVYGGDFTVRDLDTGREASVRHRPEPGPYYPAGVDDQGQVVRYERPDIPLPIGTFDLDVVDPATGATRPLPVPLAGAVPLRPAWQTPVAPVEASTLYLQMSCRGAMCLLPVSISTGTAGPAVAVTGPGSSRPVPFAAAPGDLGWTTVAALPGQGLVYRVRAQDGDDVIAVDPATGRSRRLMHVRESSPLALASLPAP